LTWKRIGWALGLIGVLLAGAALRLVWVEDIEFKTDESWTFLQTQAVGEIEPFPWLGMPTSVQFRNPGMSLWVFLGLAKLFAIHEPLALARAVQVLNTIAIALLIGFAWLCCSEDEREPWLWSSALLCVNPLAVLFHRKIWPPCVLPVFVSALLLGWWYRHRWWGAFFWGLLGGLIGQIHLGAFFFAGGFFVWAVLFDRRRIAWTGWITGSALTVLPMLPWIRYLLDELSNGAATHRSVKHALEMKFWLRWLTEPMGLGLDYTLGDEFMDFLRGPMLAAQPTYLLATLHLIAVALGGCIIIRGCWNWKRNDNHTQTALTLGAAFLGFGMLLTLSGLPLHRHYMIIAYPFELLWLARLALAPNLRQGRILLTCLVALQLGISFGFLHYVHKNGGVPGQEYGIAYGRQAILTSDP
jgi:hypothetical protein